MPFSPTRLMACLERFGLHQLAASRRQIERPPQDSSTAGIESKVEYKMPTASSGPASVSETPRQVWLKTRIGSFTSR